MIEAFVCLSGLRFLHLKTSLLGRALLAHGVLKLVYQSFNFNEGK